MTQFKTKNELAAINNKMLDLVNSVNSKVTTLEQLHEITEFSIGGGNNSVVSTITNYLIYNTNTKLTSLSLYENNITAEGATAIAAALEKNTTLTEVDLSRNNIGDEGAKAIAAALKNNTTLTTIDLKFNDIGDEEFASLYQILQQHKYLYMTFNHRSKEISELNQQHKDAYTSIVDKVKLIVQSFADSDTGNSINQHESIAFMMHKTLTGADIADFIEYEYMFRNILRDKDTIKNLIVNIQLHNIDPTKLAELFYKTLIEVKNELIVETISGKPNTTELVMHDKTVPGDVVKSILKYFKVDSTLIDLFSNSPTEESIMTAHSIDTDQLSIIGESAQPNIEL